MTIGGECVVTADASAAQLPGMTTENCAPAGDVALASNSLAAVQPAADATQPETHAPAAVDEHAKEALELQLMVFSSLLAALGIGLATFIWLKRPTVAANMAARFPWAHRVLLNKYYVDELYDVTVVQPVRVVSEDGLWRGMDARLVDGAVNGTGQVVGGMSAVMRLLQSGSVKAYAASTFVGVIAILAYYMWR
jgi:NADH-quinone oxidoreductase subunit L